MMVFSLIRSGSWSNFSSRSKVSIAFFLVSINVFSAQLWADTCRKFSPIEFVECIYIKDDSKLDSGKKPVYLPETLMTEREKEDLKQMRATEGEPCAAVYGTF